MQQNHAYVEYRTSRRFTVRERSSVVLLPDNISSERILDISEKGIAFAYRGRGLGNRVHDRAVVNIKAPNAGLSSVSVRIVSDCEIKMVDNDDDGLRRCGLEFVDLSDDQLKMIAAIIEALF